MRDLRKPSASERPLPKLYLEPKEIMDLGYEQAITALADYDGPIRSLLERIISTDARHAHVLMEDWRKEAKEIMNVIYKVNGLTQRWEAKK